MAISDKPNTNPINTGTRRLTLVGISGPNEKIAEVEHEALKVYVDNSEYNIRLLEDIAANTAITNKILAEAFNVPLYTKEDL